MITHAAVRAVTAGIRIGRPVSIPSNIMRTTQRSYWNYGQAQPRNICLERGLMAYGVVLAGVSLYELFGRSKPSPRPPPPSSPPPTDSVIGSTMSDDELIRTQTGSQH